MSDFPDLLMGEPLTLPSSASFKYTWDLFKFLDDKFSQFAISPVISSSAKIHPTSIITGPVFISADVVIEEFVVIHGPCFLGKHVHVGSFCKIRPETVLESGVRLENRVEVKHSVLGPETHIHSGYIGDSIIGRDCRIGAGFITGNRRLDRKNIRIAVGHKLIDTGTSYFGCIMGDRVHVGIHCGTNPGTVISADSVISPMTMVSHPKVSSHI